MPSRVKALQWHTAKSLHQIQLLSCDFSLLEMWESADFSAPFWRLYWHDRPGGDIIVCGKSTKLGPDRIALIPPNTSFSSQVSGTFGQFFLHFLLEPSFCGPANRIYVFKASDLQLELCKDIIGILKSDASNMKASLLAQALAALALQVIPNSDWKARFADPRITAAVAHIRARYPERTSNEELARNASLHPTAFIRLFRQCTGHTPVEFLTNLRLEEACVMLHYSEAGIDEIAEKTGFCDRGYFSRIFKAKMNCSPARYRSMVNTYNRLRS